MSEFTNNVIDASFDWTKRFAACEKIVSPFSSAWEQAFQREPVGRLLFIGLYAL
jgi:hypothetical protein